MEERMCESRRNDEEDGRRSEEDGRGNEEEREEVEGIENEQTRRLIDTNRHFATITIVIGYINIVKTQ